METQSEIESVTKSDSLGLEIDTWNIPRSTEHLLGFIARRYAAIIDKDDTT